jgi:hypothetical protein
MPIGFDQPAEPAARRPGRPPGLIVALGLTVFGIGLGVCTPAVLKAVSFYTTLTPVYYLSLLAPPLFVFLGVIGIPSRFRGLAKVGVCALVGLVLGGVCVALGGLIMLVFLAFTRLL